MKALVVFAALVCVPPDRPDPTPKIPTPMAPFREQLNGEWRVVQSLIAGRPHTTIKANQAVFVFAGDKMTIRRDDVGATEVPYSITVNDKSNPVTIDIANAKAKASKVSLDGIIKIEGDVLTMCFQSGGDRPKEFASPQNSQIILWQMKRVTK